MVRALLWLFGKLWLLVATAVILAAVATVTARQLLPLVPQYRIEIERAASVALGRPVRIGSITVGWDWMSPQVRLRDVRVLQSAKGPVALQLSRVAVGFDVLKSALWRQPVPSTVILSGVNIRLARDAQGRISLSGLPLAAPSGGGSGTATNWLYGVTFELNDASVMFSDARSGNDYRVGHIRFVMRLGADGGLQLAGGASLPKNVGSSVRIAADLHGLTSSGGDWGGRVYAELVNGQLDTPPLREFFPLWPKVRGSVSVRAWSSWTNGQLDRLSGHVAVSGFAFATPEMTQRAAPNDVLDRLSGNFALSQVAGDWQLAVAQLRTANAHAAWPTSAFSIAERKTADGRLVYGWASFLRLQDLVPFLVATPALHDIISARVDALAPRGDVSGLRFAVRLPQQGTPQLTASAQFSGVALQAQQPLPGLQGLSGAVRMTPQGGELALNSPQLALDAPWLFMSPPPAAAVQGHVTWDVRPDGLAVHANDFLAANRDAAVDGQLGLWLPAKGKPYLNLLLHMSRGDVAATRRYLPGRLFDKQLYAWLQSAFVGGQVTDGSLVLRGDPLRFPFRAHDGVFEARLQVEHGTLNYFGNWPRLHDLQGEVVFDGAGLHADATGGRMLGTRIDAAQLDIADMEKAELKISGTGAGPVADVPVFLAYTPLGDGRKALFDEMRAGGEERLALSITLPFDRGLQHWSLAGQAQVSNGAFALPEQDFALSGIDGRVSFTQRSLSAQGVKAQFRGQPAQLAATTRADGVATLTLDGHYTVAGLLGSSSPIAGFTRGATDVRLAYTLPMTPETFRRYGTGVTLVSDLRGVAVNLPAPLGKKADEARGFMLQFSAEQPGAPIRVRYGDEMQAVMRLAGNGACRYLTAADLRYARGVPKLPSEGITIEATVPELNADAWRELQTGTASTKPRGTAGAACQTAPPDPLGLIRAVSLDAGQLHLFGRDFKAVKADAERQNGRWVVNVDSQTLSGYLNIPVDLHGGTPLRFDLNRLVLQDSASAGTTAVHPAPPLNPADLPPLTGRIARLDAAGRRFNNVTLTTTPLNDGLQIHQLGIADPALQANVSGDWRQIGGRDRTQLQIELNTDNAGKALDQLGFPGVVNSGKGQGSATLDWRGAPFTPHWATLSGQANLELKDGRLDEINPGAGRLLGLFNLSQLPKNLLSGFGGLFQKGFGFDSLGGDFQFRDGNLYTQNFAIAGGSAEIGVKGRIGLAAQDYDAEVSIVPQLDSALPIAGAVLAGPAAGAVVYLLDRVLGVGKQINRAAEIKYHVGGSWDAPQIKLEKAPNNNNSPNRRNGSSPLY